MNIPEGWKEIENSMSEAEKMEFEKVMGDPTMPDDSGPDYSAWLFDKAWQAALDAPTPPEVEPVGYVSQQSLDQLKVAIVSADIDIWKQHDSVTPIAIYTSPSSPKASWDAEGYPLNLEAAARDALNLITEHNAKWKSKVVKGLRKFLGES
jgi:hypothetical protein